MGKINLKIRRDDVLFIGLFFMLCSLLVFMSSLYTLIGNLSYGIGIIVISGMAIQRLGGVINNKAIQWYISLFIILLLSTLYAVEPELSRSKLFLVASFQLPTIIGVILYCNTQEKIIKFTKLYMLVSFIMCIVILKDGPISLGNTRYGWSVTGENPNTPSMNLAAAFAFAYWNFLHSDKPSKKLIYFSLITLFLSVIFLTGSRKIIIYAIGIIVMFLMYLSTNVKNTIIYILSGLFAFVAGYYLLINVDILYENIGKRIFTDLGTEQSAVERSDLIKFSFYSFIESPIFGHGMDSFRYLNPINRYAHNNYMELLTGAGIIGAIAYYKFLVQTTFGLWKIKKNNMNFVFFSVMLMTFVAEFFNVNYLQKGIFIIYALSYCQYQVGKGRL